ncbi:hypothetical protein CFOL_v3_35022, partial [Cephalotus follicularis]
MAIKGRQKPQRKKKRRISYIQRSSKTNIQRSNQIQSSFKKLSLHTLSYFLVLTELSNYI